MHASPHAPRHPLARPDPYLQTMLWLGGTFGVLTLCLLGLLVLALILGGTGPVGLLLGLVLATVPVPAYLMLALWLDRFEAEPIWMLALAFFWGATAAAFFAFLFNSVNGAVVAAVAGKDTGEFFSAVISAPFVEETAKAAVLLLFFLWKRQEFDGVLDGLVYASMVGLGFAMTENIQYYGNALQHGVAGPVMVFILRGVLSPFAHPLFTGMTGIGLGWARQSSNPAVRWLAPPAGYASAMLLHGLWNLTASGGGGLFLVAYVLIMAPTFMGVIALAIWSMQREGAAIREHLQPEIRFGTLPEHEVRCLGSLTGRTQAAWNALMRGGVRGWQLREEFHQVCTRLALLRKRMRQGLVPPLEAAEQEELLLTRLRILCGTPA